MHAISSHAAPRSPVTRIPAADASIAAAHFERLLSLETDCWDVHQAIVDDQVDFVLLQVSGSDESFRREHLPGATHLHHSQISTETLSRWPRDTVFVAYCAGPHCNAADRAAARLAELGRPVKKMIGGKTGWLDEGFELTSS